MSRKHAHNPDETYEEVEPQLRAYLESFPETVWSFNVIYTQDSPLDFHDGDIIAPRVLD